MFARTAIAAAALAVLLLAPAGAEATQQNHDSNQTQERDGQSRHESGDLRRIPLELGRHRGGGRGFVTQMVIIQVRLAEVSRTDLRELGVEFRSEDRLDVTAVPLFGSLFEEPLSEADFTPDKAVGSAYLTEDGTLTVVLNDTVSAVGSTVRVVNGKGSYLIRGGPRLAEVNRSELSQLGVLESVQQLLTGEAAPEVGMVLGGLTATTVPDVEAKVPLLGDIPVLQSLFAGRAYRKEEKELLILIKPSIVTGEEEDY